MAAGHRLFSDNFNRANSTNLGPNWEERTGNAAIVANTLQNSVPGTEALDLWVGTVPADHASEVDLSTGPILCGVVVRVQAGANPNLYLANLSNAGQLRLWRRIGGAFTQIGATVIVALVAGAKTRLEVQGSRLRVFYGGALQISEVDGNITGAGRAGVRFGDGAALDDFAVYDFGSSAIRTRRSMGFLFNARLRRRRRVPGEG